MVQRGPFLKFMMAYSLCFILLSLAVLCHGTAAAILSTEDCGGTCQVPWPTVLPVHKLRSGRQLLGSSQNYTTELPHWVNKTMLARGQKFFHRHFYGYAYSVALTTIISGVDTQRVLISGGNTTAVEKSVKRYLINVLFFWHWATAKLDSEELFESLNLIHAVHAKVGYGAHEKYRMFESPLIPNPPRGQNPYKLNTRVWEAFERDLLASPLRIELRDKEIFPPRNGQTKWPLNQFAMAMQLYAFMSFPVTAPQKMMMSGASDEDLWAYLHFWAFIGRGLGIQDEYNVCLQPDLKTAQGYFKEILREYFMPALLDMTYEYKVVVEYFIKAIQVIINLEVGMSALIYRVCIDILEIDCPNLYRLIPPHLHSLNIVLDRGSSLFELGAAKTSGNFLINSIVQGNTLKFFGFNTLVPDNFTDGVLKLGREILKYSDVHWRMDNNDEPDQNL